MSFYQPKEHLNLSIEFYDLIQKLPYREQTIVDLYYNKKVKQAYLAEIMGVTQGAISHKLTRIKERLTYLSELKKIDFNKFFDDVKDLIEDSFDLVILQSLVQTSCQSATAWELNNKHNLKGEEKLTQIKVKHRISKLANKLKKNRNKKKYREHYKTIKKIMDNLYMLHELKMPHFDRNN